TDTKSKSTETYKNFGKGDGGKAVSQETCPVLYKFNLGWRL
ncbi:hypothetical protein HMPREF0220_3187, partial [Clostridioides difficile NAP08]